MISYDKKFIFVHINKTAGTSMEKALADYGVKKLEEKGDLKFEFFNAEPDDDAITVKCRISKC